MRPILLVTAVSMCLWYGIISGATAITYQFAPSFIPGAKLKLHKSFAKAEAKVRARLAYYRTKWRIPA